MLRGDNLVADTIQLRLDRPFFLFLLPCPPGRQTKNSALSFPLMDRGPSGAQVDGS